MLHNNILTIRDENGLGEIFHEFKLTFPSSRVTIKDIIEERVIREVESYYQKAGDYKYSLVIPKYEEEMLNQSENKIAHQVDLDKHIVIAIEAFKNNGFFVLVNDLQAEELDTLVDVTPQTTINFIKLTPLVGG